MMSWEFRFPNPDGAELSFRDSPFMTRTRGIITGSGHLGLIYRFCHRRCTVLGTGWNVEAPYRCSLYMHRHRAKGDRTPGDETLSLQRETSCYVLNKAKGVTRHLSLYARTPIPQIEFKTQAQKSIHTYSKKYHNKPKSELARNPKILIPNDR